MTGRNGGGAEVRLAGCCQGGEQLGLFMKEVFVGSLQHAHFEMTIQREAPGQNRNDDEYTQYPSDCCGS
jgi:hypothetical protein